MFGKCRLARSVVSENGNELSRFYIQIYMIECRRNRLNIAFLISAEKFVYNIFFALIIPILIVPAQSVKLSFQLHMVKIVLAQCLIKHNGNRIR